MRGLKSYLQVRSSASPSATFSSWSWSVIITMRNSNEQCQGLGSMHLGLSLSLLFLSQTEDTRTRFWILSTSFSTKIQKIWQISIWPLRPRPLRLFESDRTEPRSCQGNDKLKTQVLVNIFSRISSSISSFSGWARAIWMRWREPLLMRWLPTLWTGWRFCFYFIYIQFISMLKVGCYLPSSEFSLFKEMYAIDAANVQTRLKPASFRFDFIAR